VPLPTSRSALRCAALAIALACGAAPALGQQAGVPAATQQAGAVVLIPNRGI
jgi:hypothetical protein